MDRHSLALSTLDSEVVPLSILAENLLVAAVEAETEGRNPSTDPAVMLIGLQVAFLTHADSGILSREQLIEACELNNAVQIVPDKEKH